MVPRTRADVRVVSADDAMRPGWGRPQPKSGSRYSNTTPLTERISAAHNPNLTPAPGSQWEQRPFDFQYTTKKPYARSAIVAATKYHLYGRAASRNVINAPATPTAIRAKGNRQQAAQIPKAARMPPAVVHLTNAFPLLCLQLQAAGAAALLGKGCIELSTTAAASRAAVR